MSWISLYFYFIFEVVIHQFLFLLKNWNNNIWRPSNLLSVGSAAVAWPCSWFLRSPIHKTLIIIITAITRKKERKKERMKRISKREWLDNWTNNNNKQERLHYVTPFVFFWRQECSKGHDWCTPHGGSQFQLHPPWSPWWELADEADKCNDSVWWWTSHFSWGSQFTWWNRLLARKMVWHCKCKCSMYSLNYHWYYIIYYIHLINGFMFCSTMKRWESQHQRWKWWDFWRVNNIQMLRTLQENASQ
jgi:hypothetical protein